MFNEIGINAQKASKVIARLSTDEKNTILYDMSQELINNKDNILSSNKLDLENLLIKDFFVINQSLYIYDSEHFIKYQIQKK